MLVLSVYPLHSESLWVFINRLGRLTESAARHLMRQAVLAVQHCLDYGVFLTNLHVGNFLVQQSTMNLKLFDFEIGCNFRNEAYNYYDFIGAACCTPPEIKTDRKFHAMPANVWALGALLYFMVHGAFPYPVNDFYCGNLKINEKRLSKEICDLIKWCMALKPSDRPTFEQILDHDWLKTEPSEEAILLYKMMAHNYKHEYKKDKA
ncbi:serine/threonine-protein kinase pim-3-like [Paramisgurnus dabryanus]|uniref:serine/threonine-protein kinase pim-3-like n=1 Tax=Paramisgurnus dabryanus TaxID=90735 RepID=UPI003CCF71E2